jgi:hypothetical protein
MMNNFYINNNLDVSLSSYSNSISATTISGITYFGNINSSFITTGTSVVNNQEFSYLSGLTGYVQTQINSKLNRAAPILTFENSNNLTNDRIFSAGTNVAVSVNNNIRNYYLSIGALEVGEILVQLTGDNNYSVNNFNPDNFNGNYPNQSSVININSTNVIKISGISGGTNGKNIFLKNVGNYLIILENEGLQSNSNNRFKLSDNQSIYLFPNSSVNLIYFTQYNRWVQFPENNGVNFNYYSDFYDSAFPQGYYFTPNYYLSYPANLNGFLVYTGNAGYNISQTLIPTFTTYSGCQKGCVSLFKAKGNSTSNIPSSIGVGLQRFVNNYESTSATSLCLISSFSVIKEQSPFLGDLDNWAITFGTDNSNFSRAYSAMTNNKSTVPNLSGGSFWLFDYFVNPNYATYFVQTTGNSYISATSTFPLSSVTSTTLSTFGVYTVSQSGDSFGSSTFFWMTPTGNTQNFIIEPPITKTGGTINGFPSLNFYSAYNYSSDSNIENASKLVVDNLGINFIKKL